RVVAGGAGFHRMFSLCAISKLLLPLALCARGSFGLRLLLTPVSRRIAGEGAVRGQAPLRIGATAIMSYGGGGGGGRGEFYKNKYGGGG
ncbi:unnamed protein product, partial [Ectocarpus sp. 12 AP-2014]